MQLRWSQAIVGAAFALILYYALVVGVYLPMVGAGAFADVDRSAVTAGIHGLLGALLLGSGALTAAMVRRRWGFDTRSAVMPTVAAGAVAGLAVVEGLTLLAHLTAGAVVAWSDVAVTVGMWLVLPPVGALLVAPGDPVENRYLRRLQSDEGAGAVEYVGAIAVTVAVIAAVMVSVPGVGQALAEKLCEALTFGDGSCSLGGSAAADPHLPSEPCVLIDSADTRAASLSVLSIAIEGGGTIRVEQLSDGTWRVSSTDDVGVGVEASVGAGLVVTVDDRSWGVDAMAGAGALVGGAGGVTYVVDSESAKNDLVSYLQGKRDRASLAALGPVGGLLSGGMALVDMFDSYEPPPPAEYFGQVDASAYASASADALIIGGQADAGLEVALGGRVDVANGALTLYYSVAGDASTGAGYDDVVGYAGASAEGVVDAVVAVTFNSSGDPVSLSYSTTAAGESSAQAWDMFGGAEPVGPEGSGGRTINAYLDLTKGETERIGTDALQALGILPSEDRYGRYGDAYSAVSALVDAARRHGVVTAQDVELNSRTGFGVEGSAGAGVEVGAGFSQGSTTITSGPAWYLSNGVWKDWVACG